MDIHKPKPWIGFREFLKEYVIIVVGVLTALAAEQGVEWLHWRHVAAQVQGRLAADIGQDLVNAAEWLAIRPCFEGRVAELASALQRPDPMWTSKAIDWTPVDMRVNTRPDLGRALPLVMVAPGRNWVSVTWDSALSNGALSHMPAGHVDLYARLFRDVESARQGQLASAAAEFQLVPLGFDRPLSPAERTAFLGRLAEVESEHRLMYGMSRHILITAQGLGLAPRPSELAERIAQARQQRGDCVSDLKLPLV